MAISHGQVDVANTATEIIPADPDGMYVYIAVSGEGNIFVGGSGVTTSNGMRILANGNRDLFLGPGEALYGVCNAGTVKTTYLASMNE